MAHSKAQKPKVLWEPPASVLEAYNPLIRSAKDDSGATSINIFSTIGEWGDGAGMTAKIVDAVLRRADGGAVVVNINSPGGDFDEGIAIHSLLSAYKGDVKVRVLSLAASAASIVAMAGKSIEIVEAGRIMIHNAWTVAIGNKHDMKAVTDYLSKIDDLAAKLYAKRSASDMSEVSKMMDNETFLSADESVEMGFADSIIDSGYVSEAEETKSNAALREMDIVLAKAGVPRAKRREMIKSLVGDTPGVIADHATPSAGLEHMDAVQRIISKLNN